MAVFASHVAHAVIQTAVTRYASHVAQVTLSFVPTRYASHVAQATLVFQPTRYASHVAQVALSFVPTRYASHVSQTNLVYMPSRFASHVAQKTLIFLEVFDPMAASRMRIPIKWLKQDHGYAEDTLRSSGFTARANRGLYRVDLGAAAGSVEMALPTPARLDDVCGVMVVTGDSGTKKAFVSPPTGHTLLARGKVIAAGDQFQLATHGLANFPYMFEFDDANDRWRLIQTTERLLTPTLTITDATGTFEADPWASYFINLTTGATIELPSAAKVGACEIEFISTGAAGTLTINRKAGTSDTIVKEGTVGLTSTTWTPGAVYKRMALRSIPATDEWLVIHDTVPADRY